MGSRARREERRLQALERQASRENRGDAGQLRRLEQRGFGECREATRLRQKLLKKDQGSESEAQENVPETEA